MERHALDTTGIDARALHRDRLIHAGDRGEPEDGRVDYLRTSGEGHRRQDGDRASKAGEVPRRHPVPDHRLPAPPGPHPATALVVDHGPEYAAVREVSSTRVERGT